MTDLVPVRVPCPSGQHPDGDSVCLKPKLGLAGGTAAQQTIQDFKKGVTSAEVTGVLMEVYLRHGVAEWTLHDDTGKAIELTPETLQAHLLDDFERSKDVADKADELYFEPVVAPLVGSVSRQLQATQPGPSISAGTGSPASPRKRSKRSSTSTTQTADTELTSA